MMTMMMISGSPSLASGVVVSRGTALDSRAGKNLGAFRFFLGF